LDRAAQILDLVVELADAIRDNEHSPGEESQRRVASAWKALRPAIIEVGESLPSDPNPVADWIREVGRVSKQFEGALRQHGLAHVLFWYNCASFDRVAHEGQKLFSEMAAKRYPFAFVDAPAASNPSGAAVETPKQIEPAAEPVGDTSTPTKAKRRGRKKANYETVQKEDALAAKWKRARAAGTCKVDFAKQNKMTLKDFDRMLNRVRKRESTSE
jgi:hypothetical protein